MPSASTGAAISTQTATSDPTKTPALTSSSALTDSRRKGPATNGTTASMAAAASVTRQSPRRPGRRSASRPPTQ